MTTFSQLLNKAVEIKDETVDNANSAERVGGLLDLLVRALVLPYDPSRDYIENQYCIFNDALYRAKTACAPGESPSTAAAKWQTGDGTLQLVTDRGAVTTNTIDVGGIQSSFEAVEGADGVIVATALNQASPAKKKQKFITLDNFGKAIQGKLDWSKVTIQSFTNEEGVIRLELEDDTLDVFELDLNEEFLRKADADDYLSEKFDSLADNVDLAFVLKNGNNSVGADEDEDAERGATLNGLLAVKEMVLSGAAVAERVDYLLGIDLRTNKIVKVTSGQTAEYIDPETETPELPANNSPVAPTYATINATAGQSFAVDLENFTDPDGDPITAYTLQGGLPAGVGFNLTSLLVSGTINVAGNYQIQFRGYDSRGGYANGVVNIVVSEAAGSLSMAEPTYNTTTGALRINATSPDTSTTLEFQISGLRAWGTSPNFTIPEWQRSGVLFVLEVRQGSRTASRNFTTPTVSNRPPRVIMQTPAQTLTVGQAFSFQVPTNAFIDDDNDPLAYSSTGNPPGSFSWTGRVHTGTPTTPGTYQTTITVTDGKGGSASQVVTYTVNAATSSLALTEPTYNTTTGALTANISGGDGTQVQYSIPDISAAYQTSANFTIPGSKRGTTITIYALQSGVTVSRPFAVPSVNPISNLQGRFYSDGFLRATIKVQFNGLSSGSTPQIGLYYPAISPANAIAWVNMSTTSESGFSHTVNNFVGIPGSGYGGDILYFIRAGSGTNQPIYQIRTRNPTVVSDTGFVELTLTVHNGIVGTAPTASISYQSNTSYLNLSVVNISDGSFELINNATPSTQEGFIWKYLLDNNEWIDTSALTGRRFPVGTPVKVEYWEIDPVEQVWSWRGDDRRRGETLIQVS